MAYQDNTKARQNKKGKHLLSFHVDETHLALINQLSDFYKIANKDELFQLMIEKYYEYYVAEKEDTKNIEIAIGDLQNRIGKLEDKFSKIYDPIKSPVKKRPVAKKSWTQR